MKRNSISNLIFLSALVLVLYTSGRAETLIIRSTQECCKQSPNFAIGSEAFLIDSTKVVGHCKIKKEGPFTFEDIEPGR